MLRMGIFLSLGIQILFGLIWAMANFATVSQFESSSLLLEGIHNFIQSNLVLCVLVYLFQLVAAYMAGFYMLGGFGVQGGYKIFGTLALLTSNRLSRVTFRCFLILYDYPWACCW